MLAKRPRGVRGTFRLAARHGDETALAQSAREPQSVVSRDPLEEPTWDELSPHVDVALQNLAEKFRILIVLHYLQRQRAEDLAEQFALTQTSFAPAGG